MHILFYKQVACKRGTKTVKVLLFFVSLAKWAQLFNQKARQIIRNLTTPPYGS